MLPCRVSGATVDVHLGHEEAGVAIGREALCPHKRRDPLAGEFLPTEFV